jgi:hypothetical protein
MPSAENVTDDSLETMMRSLLAAFFAVLLMQTAPASAAIRIVDSAYENGTLTVTGEVRPNEPVSLDGKYNTKADGAGHFEFHVQYKPDTCMTTIATGVDSYSAVVTGCLLSDAAASAAVSPK